MVATWPDRSSFYFPLAGPPAERAALVVAACVAKDRYTEMIEHWWNKTQAEVQGHEDARVALKMATTDDTEVLGFATRRSASWRAETNAMRFCARASASSSTIATKDAAILVRAICGE